MVFFFKNVEEFQSGPKKRTSIGDGRRKAGSYKRKSQKKYRGQGK